MTVARDGDAGATRLRAARRLRAGRELEQAVETTSGVDFSSGCGVPARLHGRRPTWVRQLPSGGRPVTLVWVKRVWRCPEPTRAVSTWSETSGHIRARASLTERAGREICRRVGQDGHAVAQVARSSGSAGAPR